MEEGAQDLTSVLAIEDLYTGTRLSVQRTLVIQDSKLTMSIVTVA